MVRGRPHRNERDRRNVQHAGGERGRRVQIKNEDSHRQEAREKNGHRTRS